MGKVKMHRTPWGYILGKDGAESKTKKETQPTSFTNVGGLGYSREQEAARLAPSHCRIRRQHLPAPIVNSFLDKWTAPFSLPWDRTRFQLLLPPPRVTLVQSTSDIMRAAVLQAAGKPMSLSIPGRTELLLIQKPSTTINSNANRKLWWVCCSPDSNISFSTVHVWYFPIRVITYGASVTSLQVLFYKLPSLVYHLDICCNNNHWNKWKPLSLIFYK